ncbi:GNAT family N-acetyltransferase [Aestuariibius sp. 2305UL40-4]|uniref:GNAT family N-acetyltransferase n=1 Tax=Aestuariibius violaceus TaxID=3234132 RepID=UPI00345F0BE9
MHISLATTDKDIADCLHLRRAVFIDEQGVSEAEEVDGEDNACSHVLARDNGRPVGAARFHYKDGTAKIQRVCVPKDHRGKGYGACLMSFMIDHIRQDGAAHRIELGAQTHAIPFYAALGFTPYGPDYLDAAIPHRDMELRLARPHEGPTP